MSKLTSRWIFNWGNHPAIGEARPEWQCPGLVVTGSLIQYRKQPADKFERPNGIYWDNAVSITQDGGDYLRYGQAKILLFAMDGDEPIHGDPCACKSFTELASLTVDCDAQGVQHVGTAHNFTNPDLDKLLAIPAEHVLQLGVMFAGVGIHQPMWHWSALTVW